MVVCLYLVIIFRYHLPDHINILIAGGYDIDDDDVNRHNGILEYNPEEDSIVSVGQMIQARSSHAINVVQVKDYVQWCQ